MLKRSKSLLLREFTSVTTRKASTYSITYPKVMRCGSGKTVLDIASVFNGWKQ